MPEKGVIFRGDAIALMATQRRSQKEQKREADDKS